QARALVLEDKKKVKDLKASDVAQLSGVSVLDSSRISTAAIVEDAASDEEEEAPTLLDPDIPDLDATINKADLVIQVLDSRDPLSYRVPSFEKTLAERGKKLIFVLNKTELVPREAVSAWLSHLRLEHPTFPFKPSTAFLTSIAIPVTPKGKEKAPLDDELGAAGLRECIATLAKGKNASGATSSPFVVAFVGMANTGKSAIINSLLHEEGQKVYRIRVGDDPNSRTTLHPRRVPSAKLSVEDGLEITLIDTPGFTFEFPANVANEELVELRTKETLFHRRGLFEKMRYPFNAASWVLLRTNPDDIQVLYNTQAFDSNDLEAMIRSLGRASGRLSSSGKTDKESTARMILRDWRQGKLGIYTLPPKSSLSTILSTTPGSSPFKDLYERTDSLVLDNLPTKAEMIAGPHGSSVVRFKVGEPWPESVQVDLHARYDAGGEDGELNGVRVRKGFANGDHMNVDEDSEDEDEDEEDELDEDDEMEDGEDQSNDEEEEWGGFGSGNESGSGFSGDEDSDEEELPPLPKSKSKRRASPNRPLEPAPLKASKSKKVAFASAKTAAAPATSATSRLGSTKEAKPSKTSLKKATQDAAKERSRAAAAKSSASKPSAKSTAPVEQKSSLKVTNEPSAARKKALAAAAATGDLSEQPYDFNLHFK
ncbi:hypothetical protein FRC00_004925, partial [Tulasnella sp. 408]